MRRRWLPIGCLLALAGCGEVDGSQPFAGTQRYQPTDKAYTVRYLSPPWLLVVTSGEQASFAVSPMLLDLDLTQASVVAQIQADSTRAQAAATAALAAWKAAHPHATVDPAPTTVENAAGQNGFQWNGLDGALYHREVYFDATRGSFALLFDGKVSLDGPDVTSFIAGFATGSH